MMTTHPVTAASILGAPIVAVTATSVARIDSAHSFVPVPAA